jgi:hypothetical protein
MPCVVSPEQLVPLDGVVFRITDHQGYQATERWSRNLAEQVRLEALISLGEAAFAGGQAGGRSRAPPA